MIKFLLPFVFLLSACSATMEARLGQVRKDYQSQEFALASQTFADEKNIKEQDNLQVLISADSLFHQNKLKESDEAYEEFNKRNINLTDGKLLREANSLVLGNMANDYRPYMMDSLFVSYYQLWAALAENRKQDARVIINQAYARQQKMAKEYEEILKKSQEQYNKNPSLVKELKEENSKWKAYENIMNPALTYLSGLYFLNTKDYEQARTYLERTSGMVPDNDFVKQDLGFAKSKQTPKNTVWVFIEDGFAPSLKEEKMSLPIFVGDNMTFATIAISNPVFHKKTTKVNGAELLANVDDMFMTEYSEYRINEALRAWLNTTSKVALQASLYNSGNQYSNALGLASSFYTMASTNAEVRSWVVLPKTISLLRLDNTRSFDLKSGVKILENIKIPTDGNYLVYIRLNLNDIKIIKLF